MCSTRILDNIRNNVRLYLSISKSEHVGLGVLCKSLGGGGPYDFVEGTWTVLRTFMEHGSYSHISADPFILIA